MRDVLQLPAHDGHLHVDDPGVVVDELDVSVVILAVTVGRSHVDQVTAVHVEDVGKYLGLGFIWRIIKYRNFGDMLTNIYCL